MPFPTYPAITLPQAEALIKYSGNQLHDIVNGDGVTTIDAEDGPIPSVRKMLVDNLNFISPLDWNNGANETTFNQLRKFTDGTWWFAPTATVSTPIAMGVTPIGDSNWKPWSRDQQLTYELAVRSYAEAGYDVIGTFEIGCTATALNQIVLYMYEGKGYEWTGAFPKVVPPASTPAGTGGVGVGAWVDRTDVALRVDLAAEDGASLSLSQIATAYGINFSDGMIWESGVTTTSLDQWFFYDNRVWSPLVVGNVTGETPDYTLFYFRSADGELRPSQFGAVGDADLAGGTPNPTPTNDTTAIVRGITYAASVGKNLIPDDSVRYSVSSLSLPSGITEFKGFKIRSNTSNDQLIYTAGPIFGGGTNFSVDISYCDLDLNSLSRHGVLLNGASYCNVHNNNIYNSDVANSACVRITTNCDNIDIYNNTLTCGVDPDDGAGSDTIDGILITAETTSIYGGIDVGGVPVYPGSITTTRINVYNNKIYNGTHHIHVTGLVYGNIYNNLSDGASHRNINLSPACQRINVIGNMLLNAGSSGVNVAWGCSKIKVANNKIYSFQTQTHVSDDCAIQAYKDIEYLEILGNDISGDWTYCIYLGQVKRAVVANNNFYEGGSKANIQVESDWVSSVPANAIYTKARIGVAASTNSFDIVIRGNNHNGSGNCALSFTGFGTKTLDAISVSGEMINGTDMNHYIHVYDDTTSTLISSAISVSTIHGVTPSPYAKFYTNNGRVPFDRVIDVVGLEDEFQNELQITSTTPSVLYGPNFSMASAYTITNFTDGMNGQVIRVRLFNGTVITHNASLIRLKGDASINATSSSQIVTLKRIAGIWFELSRNF